MAAGVTEAAMFSLVLLVLLFPLMGLSINLVFDRRLGDPGAGILASLSAGLAFVVSLVLLAALRLEPQGAVIPLATWIQIGTLDIPWALQVDTLSLTMMLVVSGVGAVIHFYAIAYMRGDPGFVRFFIYLNLFLFAMLVLVSASNYAMLFVGWEGVGLCSYLLIGFWFDRGEQGIGNASAARKAFVVNRIGDLGFLLALFLMFWTFGSLNFADISPLAEEKLALGAPLAVGITTALLVAAIGKSAQIPLFVWLPDAMAGPTPVSALIHAATMVTAGVYLIARSQFLFDLAPLTQMVTAGIGAVTALMAAAAAAGQFDIKRVLAYSTISQLGFMMTAVGLGAYAAGIFHLTTHAFFKALLFLAAGSVVHALQHNHGAHMAHRDFDPQDMRGMGGLHRRMPVTFWVYLIGALALAGLPPLSGFFSKDEILLAAFVDQKALFAILLAAAFLTSFYMARQIWLVFFGPAKSPAAAAARESPAGLAVPLVILAALAVVGGGLNLPGSHAFSHWLERTLEHLNPPSFDLYVALLATLLALAGITLASVLYRRALRAGQADPLERILGRMFGLLGRGWGLDDIYAALIIRPYGRLTARLADLDLGALTFLEGLPVGLIRLLSAGSRLTQTGQLNWNVAGIVFGVIAILLVLVWMQ